jgi:zinc finger protein
MSTDDQTPQVTKKQDPQEFFQAIGDKVKNFSAAPDGEAAPNSAAGADDERPPVEEVESLCMNCGKNVSTLRTLPSPRSRSLPYSASKSQLN